MISCKRSLKANRKKRQEFKSLQYLDKNLEVLLKSDGENEQLNNENKKDRNDCLIIKAEDSLNDFTREHLGHLILKPVNSTAINDFNCNYEDELSSNSSVYDRNH